MRRELKHWRSALTRPRVWNRRARRRLVRTRKSERGVAILLVITTMMVMVILVTELTYSARVRVLVAAHQSDRVAAYWLARSGVNLYRMLLMGSRQMQGQIDSLVGSAGGALPDGFADSIPDNLWQLLPVVNTGLLRMMLGGDVSSADDLEGVNTDDLMSLRDSLDEEQIEESRDASLFADRNFLDFEGDFSVEVFDHDSRININAFATDTTVNAIESPTGQQLFALMSGPENDQWFYERGLDRWEVIGNLKDWADPDGFRSGGLGGQEDSLYNTQDPPYLAKNAAFDTLQEVRTVEGWQGEVFDKFGQLITVFGDPLGKINIQTADPLVVDALVRGAAQQASGAVVQDSVLEQCRVQIGQAFPWGFFPDSAQELVDAYQNNCGLQLDKAWLQERIGNQSNTFTITSTGLVGNSSITITAVLDFRNSPAGELIHWRVD